MKLSVVIPCYNAADTLAEQLEALARQTWGEPWEVILANNGSTDNSVEIARQYQDRLPNLRIIDASGRQGQPYALNVGALMARGEALAFCDADDVVGDGWLAAIGNALARHDFVACRWETDLLNPDVIRKSRSNGQKDALQAYTYPPFLSHAGGGTIGIRRDLHLAVGGFDETLPTLHDTDYCWRLQLRGIHLHFVPDAVMHIRFRDTASGNYKQARAYGEYNVLLYKKYHPLGMPALRWMQALSAWFKLLSDAPFALTRGRRIRWMRRLGWRIGRLRGCVKHRVLAP